MSRSEPRGHLIERIVHPTDFSHGSEVAFAHALKLAVGLRTKLDIVHVDAHPSRVRHSDFPGVHDTLIRWGLLPEGADRREVAKLGVGVHKSAPQGDDPVSGLLGYLQKHRADLVVLATHRRHGLDRWLHQQVAGQIAELAHVPTLFVPYDIAGFVDWQHGECSLHNAVLPVTHDPSPQPAVDVLNIILHGLGVTSPATTICHFGDDEADAPLLNYPHDHDWQWDWLIRPGNPVDSIIEVCDQKSADLIAMTTDGHHGFLDALRGTTTDRVLQRSPCPLLAVPAGRLSVRRRA